MRKTSKVIAIIMVMTLVMASFAGCGGGGGSSDTTTELYIYNSKGENAAQFDQMAQAFTAETGVPVKTFSIGSGQDHMETLRAEMQTSNMPTIFSIQGLKELQEWQEGGFVFDFASAEDAAFAGLTQAIDPGLRLTTDGTNSYGIPYNVEGYGYIVDHQMLADLFGEADADGVCEDLKACSYDDWAFFIAQVDRYIKSGGSPEISINGNQYFMQATKTGLAQNLTGVFAVMGSQKWTYGDHFVNVALNAGFDSAAAAFAADESKIKGLYDIFIAYAKALDYKTSYLAGANGPIVRGADFVSDSNTGYDQTVQIFADSKALFLKQGNWAYGNIEGVNPEMAARLDFLPVKMPMTDSMMKVSGLSAEKFNQSIPVFVPNFYAINAKATPEQQQVAMDFLVWLNTSDTGAGFIKDSFNFIPYNADPTAVTLGNSLGNAILTYMADNNTLAAPYHGAPASWSGEVLGLLLLEKYMNKEKWTDADYEAIANYAIDKWIELK